MDLLQKLAKRYKDARGKAGALLNRYHDEMDAGKTDEAKATLEKQERAFADAQRAHEDLERARQSNDLPDLQIVRGDTFLGNSPSGRRDGADRDLTPPSPRELADRHELLIATLSGRELTEEETVQAYRVFPVEKLFVKRILQLSQVDGYDFEPDERKAWAQYQASMRSFNAGNFESRAYTNVMNLADGAGAEVIPTVLQTRIWPDVYRMGPLADDTGLTVIRLPWEAKTEVALLGGTPDAVVRGPGVDGDPVKPTTGKIAFSPKKYSLHVPLASEILIGGGYTDIETRITQWIAKGFGRRFNIDRTDGDGGNAHVKGFLQDAQTGVTTASGTAITATEVRDLIIAYGEDYLGRPGTRFMCTLATENYIAQLRTSNGQREFPLNGVEGRPILPYGVGMPTWNRAMDQIPTTAAAGNEPCAIVDLAEYAVLYIGQMRFAREYDVLSDSQLLGVFMSTDSKLIQDGSVKTASAQKLVMKSN